MKAYAAQNEYSCYGTVVFAETAGKAKVALMSTDCFEGFEYTELRPYRVKELDKEYRGHHEMDWFDEADRIALVKLGWHCGPDYDYDDCKICPAKEWCVQYEEENK